MFKSSIDRNVSLLFCVLIFWAVSSAFGGSQKLGIDPNWDGINNPHKELKKVGDTFSFAIVGCAQVGHEDDKNALFTNAQYGLKTTVQELNAMEHRPDFAVFLGDLVNKPDRPSIENFYNLIKPLKSFIVLNHGNHDTPPPYTRFRDLEEKVNGIRSVYYSFDVGRWHFITLPANIEFGNYGRLEVKKPMMEWLAKDLEANKNRPTIVFVHMHFMPSGLTQLEWYTHTTKFKRELLDSLSKWGNVKWYFNAHVHNGIKVALKTAWTYKGINFLTVPSGTSPRPYGEEFSQFAEGLDRGGYYSIVDVNDEKVTIRSRLSGKQGEFVFPDKFQEFSEDKDLRLLTRAIDLPARPMLQDGDFEKGISGWYVPQRYVCDGDVTGFLTEWRMKHKREGAHSGYVYAIPLGKNWLRDEYNEFYQVVAMPQGNTPIFKGSYFIEQPAQAGGGYYRLIAIGGTEGQGEFKFLMQFDWGKPQDQRSSDYYPRAMGYHIAGEVSSWLYLQKIGKEKKGMYFHIPSDPGKWHDLQINIPALYDQAMGSPGAFAKLGVRRFMIAAGVWSIKDVEIGSGAFFDAITFENGLKDVPSRIEADLVQTSDEVFKTSFGQELQDDKSRHKNVKRAAEE